MSPTLPAIPKPSASVRHSKEGRRLVPRKITTHILAASLDADLPPQRRLRRQTPLHNRLVADLRVALRRVRGATVGLAVSAFLLAIAAPALASDSVSLRGIRLLATPTQVRHALGRPSSIHIFTTGRCNHLLTYRYPHELTITFASTPTLTRPYRCPILVNVISTRSPRDKVKMGLHVGSSYGRLKAALRHLTCASDGGTRLVAGTGGCDFTYRTIRFKAPPGRYVQPVKYIISFTLRHSRISVISLEYAQGA